MAQPDLYAVLAGMVGRTVLLRGGELLPMKVASVQRSGSTITMKGFGPDGRPLSRVATKASGSPVMAQWQVRIASILQTAGLDIFDATVKDMIHAAGLPVDHHIDWDAFFNFKMNQVGVAHDDETRRDLGQDILTTLLGRHTLERFNPNAIDDDDPNYAQKSLEQKVTSWMKQNIGWQLSKKEAFAPSRTGLPPEEVQGTPMGSEPDAPTELDLAEGDLAQPGGPEHAEDFSENLQGLRHLRASFASYLRGVRYPENRARRVLSLFDFGVNFPGDPWDMGSAYCEAYEIPRHSYIDLKKALSKALLAFAADRSSPKERGGLAQQINDLRLRGLTPQPGDLEVKQETPDLSGLTPAAEEEAPVAAGPKAEAMKASSLNRVMAGWQTRLAGMMCIAAGVDWDHVVKELIKHAGFPVDPEVNWTAILKAKAGAKSTNQTRGESLDWLIQDALSAIVTRHALERFDPNAVKGDTAYQSLSLAKKVTIYLNQLINWQFTNGEVFYPTRQSTNENETTDEREVRLGLGGHGPQDWDRDPLENAESTEAGPDVLAAEAGDAESLDQFRRSFYQFLKQSCRNTATPNRIMLIFDIITKDQAPRSTAKMWMQVTEGTQAMYRGTLQTLREWLHVFAQSDSAPKGSRFVDMLRSMVNRAEAVPMAASLAHGETASFMRALGNEVVRLASEGSIFTSRTAKPKVVDSSILFVVLGCSPLNYLNMSIRFGGPSIAKTPGAGTEYTIDVGLYGPDRSLPENKIRKQLNALVFPSMRADVPDNFHNLLEKVIRELRGIVWEKAVEFFEVPKEERAAWKHVIRMNVLTLQDVKVTLAEDGTEFTAVTGSGPCTDNGIMVSEQGPGDHDYYGEGSDAKPKESSMTTTRFAKLKKAAEEAPQELGAKLEDLKQTLLDQVTCLENLQEQLDMPESVDKFEGPEEEKPEEFAGLKKAAEEEPEEIEAAIQDFFLGLDQAMAQTEAIADELGVELVAPSSTEEGEINVDPDHSDEGDDSGVEIEEEEDPEGDDLVEFSGTADPATAKKMFDAGAKK